MIDSKKSERVAGGKPLRTFPGPALAQARRRLAPPPVRREPVWPTLAAAAFFAVCALAFAAAAILAPPVQLAPAPATSLRGTD